MPLRPSNSRYYSFLPRFSTVQQLTLRSNRHRKLAMASATTAATTRRRSARLSSQDVKKASPEAMPPPPAPQNKRKRTATTGSAGTKKSSDSTIAPTPPEAPSTPTKKRTLQNLSTPPPLTPTPSAVGIIAQPVNGRAAKKPRNDSVTRLADPKSTNAPLLSPETSRLWASPDVESASPSKKAVGTTTTKTLLQEANAHLIKVDERIRPLVENNHCRAFSPEGLAEKIDPFESLTSGIISQQVSGAAAKSIKAKFVALFDKDDGQDTAGRRFPHPSEVVACPMERLRFAGLSQRKAEYIQGLAEKFTKGELTAQMLHDAPFEEVLEKLIAVRGLGRWSVEMFACFALKRMDVFSLGDLGVQRGMAAFVGRDVAKLKTKGGGKWKYMSEKDMLELSEKFSPYRSLFMWYMWRVEETDISTME
jgi:DNA-3-methyladenine glycosylase II